MSVQDESIMEGLAFQLPLAIQEEQIATYDRHLEGTAVVVPSAKKPKKSCDPESRPL